MEECLLATAELGVQGGDSGRPGCPAVGAARGQRGTGSRDTPWLLHRGPTRRSQDDSQPAAPSRAPGCLPAGGTAPPSPGPRPCPPAGHQTTAAEPASAHSSRRSASCSQRRDPRLQGCLAWPGEETAGPGSREPFRNRVRALHWPPGSLDPSCRLSGASATGPPPSPDHHHCLEQGPAPYVQPRAVLDFTSDKGLHWRPWELTPSMWAMFTLKTRYSLPLSNSCLKRGGGRRPALLLRPRPHCAVPTTAPTCAPSRSARFVAGGSRDPPPPKAPWSGPNPGWGGPRSRTGCSMGKGHCREKRQEHGAVTPENAPNTQRR